MIARSARGTDWKHIEEMVLEAHARSNLAGYALDHKYTKDLFLGLMMANCKTPVPDSGHVFVAQHDDGSLHGFIVAGATRLCVFGRDLVVSDMAFYCRLGAAGDAAHMLWHALECWASTPAVVAIRPCVNNFISDPERTAKFYEARGYERFGLMLEKRKPPRAADRRLTSAA